MQTLIVLQSLWAMERRHTDGFEQSLDDNVAMIAAAGYGGVSGHCTDREAVRRLAGLARAHGLVIEGQAFPQTIDDLKADPRDRERIRCPRTSTSSPTCGPRRLAEASRLVEGWRRLAEQVPFPVLIETHRDRMTTDLHFVLDLLDRHPELPLIADLSHFLVGREFAWPVPDEHHAEIHRILDNSWAFHGRVGTREQVQIEISFPHHRAWVDLFLGWWDYGFRSWRRRAAADASVTFTCELGPQPYAITGRDGNDTTDRWAEALAMKGMVEDLFRQTANAKDRAQTPEPQLQLGSRPRRARLRRHRARRPW